MFELILDGSNRIVGVQNADIAYYGGPTVDALPEGNFNDYRFVDGSYIHDPIPETKSKSEPEEMYMLTKSQYEKVLKLIGEEHK